jgi:site-specific DNA recombinase
VISKQTGKGTMRAVIYARYSSGLQRDASIEDQIRLCRARIELEG